MNSLRKYGLMGANKRAAQELLEAGYQPVTLPGSQLTEDMVSTSSATIESPLLRAQLVRFDGYWLARIADREKFRNWQYQIPDDQRENFRLRFMAGEFDASVPADWVAWTPPAKPQPSKTSKAEAPQPTAEQQAHAAWRKGQDCLANKILLVENWSLTDEHGKLLRDGHPNRYAFLSGRLFGHHRIAAGAELPGSWKVIRGYQDRGQDWVICEDPDGCPRHFMLGELNANFTHFLKVVRSKLNPLAYVRNVNFEGTPPPPPVYPGNFNRNQG